MLNQHSSAREKHSVSHAHEISERAAAEANFKILDAVQACGRSDRIEEKQFVLCPLACEERHSCGGDVLHVYLYFYYIDL
jgi:predicted Zn-ribbon and HTH transcriptional regulator